MSTRSLANLAEALRDLRQRAGLTQVQLAELCETSQAQIARLESGRSSPTWATIERIASVAGCSVTVVFESEPPHRRRRK